MFKVAALLLLLANQPVRYEVIGHLSSKPRMRFGQVRIESLDGRFVLQTYFGPDGRFRLTKVPDGQYVVTVRIGRIREIRQTISVLPEFADKKHRVSFKLDVDKAIVQQSAQKANVAALLVPDKARTELRKSFEAKGDLEKAQQHLEAALKIAPNFEEALNNLGTIYYRKHDFVAAKDLFERALKSNPESFVGRVNLGGALLGLGDFNRALAENTKAATQRPTDSLAQAQLGLSFFYLRKLDEAVPHLEQAKQADPFSPALPGLFLAMIHESRGNTGAAITEYAEFLKMHPNHSASTNIERKLAALKGSTEKH
jgi:Tfp pilus assembly protein PilF